MNVGKNHVSGSIEESSLVYHRMHLEGVQPDAAIVIAALKSCSRCRDWETGKKIHAFVMENRDDRDIYVANTLVAMYAKCGRLIDAQKAFDQIQNRTVVSWTPLLFGYADGGEGDLALGLFASMKAAGCFPNRVSFLAVIKACSSLAADEEGKHLNGKLIKVSSLRKGREIHREARSCGHELDTGVATSLVDMYAKCGCMTDARCVFDRMRAHDIVAWNSLILGHAENGEGETALELFEEMQRQGIRPNDRTFVSAVKACGAVDGSLLKLRVLHSQIQEAGVESNIFVASSLVDSYAKRGSLWEARDVFDVMKVHDAVAWNAMILGYVEAGENELGLQLYQRMQDEGCQPNRVTFIAALKACSASGALELGRCIEVQIFNHRLEKDLVLGTSVVDFYGKCGSMADAQRVFDSFPGRSLVTWNALIAGYSRQGDSKQVFELFEGMQRQRLQPDAITFLSVLAVCCHAGLVEEGKEYFRSMHSKFRVDPTAEHYNYMVELLSGGNQLDDAVTMVRSMPFQPTLSVWITLLGACRKWRNVVIGRLAFEAAVRLDAKKATAYLLIATIYEEAGLWEESARVQALVRHEA